ncbi:hypothetical protein ACLB2K_044141 [Fragaria x ananassa]
MARDNMEAVKFQSEARNAESLDQETLVGIISGPYTRNILEAVRTGAITRKTIRDVLFQDSLKKFDKNVVYRDVAHFHQLMMKKRQFGSKNLSASGTEKGIPEFWLYDMNAIYVLDKEIKDYDQGALKHLVNIKWLRTNLKVFKLEFYFRPNSFFKNSILTVTYHMTHEDEFIIEKILGTEIEWTSKNRLKKRRPGNRRSFFDIFSPPEAHDACKDLKLKDILQRNYLIGSIIRDDIIPRAVSWFTGEAMLEQFEEMASGHEDFLKSLSQDVQKRVELLKRIQKDHDRFDRNQGLL